MSGNEQIDEQAQELKLSANKSYSEKSFDDAISLYKQAIGYFYNYKIYHLLSYQLFYQIDQLLI